MIDKLLETRPEARVFHMVLDKLIDLCVQDCEIIGIDVQRRIEGFYSLQDNEIQRGWILVRVDQDKFLDFVILVIHYQQQLCIVHV